MIIVRYDDTSILAVLQIDHCRLAGELAAHWGNDRFAEPVPFDSVVVAAQEHDSGWWNWEIRPTIGDDGRPIDYQRWWIGIPGMSRHSPATIKELADLWVSFYRDGIDRVVEQDPYSGLLMLMHGTGLLSQAHGIRPILADMRSDPVARAFIDEREQLQAQLLKELRASSVYGPHTSDEAIWHNFKLLEVFDQAAQYICNRYPINGSGRQSPPSLIQNVPTRLGEADTSVQIVATDERTATLTPWPFDVNRLDIAYPARILPDRSFESQNEFRRAYYKAPRITVAYTLTATGPT